MRPKIFKFRAGSAFRILFFEKTWTSSGGGSPAASSASTTPSFPSFLGVSWSLEVQLPAMKASAGPSRVLRGIGEVSELLGGVIVDDKRSSERIERFDFLLLPNYEISR